MGLTPVKVERPQVKVGGPAVLSAGSCRAAPQPSHDVTAGPSAVGKALPEAETGSVSSTDSNASKEHILYLACDFHLLRWHPSRGRGSIAPDVGFPPRTYSVESGFVPPWK